MFLGYKVSTRGLKVYPDKVDAVLSLSSPKCLKDVQKLNGKLTNLNRFLAKSAEKSLPFFKTLKKCTKRSDFYWTTEAEKAFKQMKWLIAEVPMLVALVEKEELIVYLAATKETVNTVLMTEREAKQMLVYFVSRALRADTRGVIKTSSGSKVAEMEHRIRRIRNTLQTRVSVKGQILADFIVERPKEDSPDTLMEEAKELLEPWILFTDGSSYTDGSKAVLILTNPEGMEFTYALIFSSFKAFSIKQFPRSENKKADALSKIASTRFAHLSKQVLVEELKEKSINATEVLAVVEEEGDTWMTPIFKYLTDGTLPAEAKKARAVRRKSWRFSIINGTLYKKYFLGPWLRCVGPLQANYVLREIHEGSCSMYTGTRTIMAKALRFGYYRPTMHEDARMLIRACQDCQVHKPVPRNPQQKLSPITSPWPFYKWGIDIVGPFPEGPVKVKFLIVSIDYFTKWIEAKPVATITGN
ncbi:reverse transcriptase domain-containing protein [Tanacetum coccineum]